MKLIINNSSMQPLYEQIVEQIKGKIMRGLKCLKKNKFLRIMIIGLRAGVKSLRNECPLHML